MDHEVLIAALQLTKHKTTTCRLPSKVAVKIKWSVFGVCMYRWWVMPRSWRVFSREGGCPQTWIILLGLSLITAVGGLVRFKACKCLHFISVPLVYRVSHLTMVSEIKPVDSGPLVKGWSTHYRKTIFLINILVFPSLSAFHCLPPSLFLPVCAPRITNTHCRRLHPNHHSRKI